MTLQLARGGGRRGITAQILQPEQTSPSSEGVPGDAAAPVGSPELCARRSRGWKNPESHLCSNMAKDAERELGG